MSGAIEIRVMRLPHGEDLPLPFCRPIRARSPPASI